MLIKLVNPQNKDEVCIYGEISDFRMSSKGSTPVDIDRFIDNHANATEHHISKDTSRPIMRVFFELYNIKERYEIFTNWKIYLMDDKGETIESL